MEQNISMFATLALIGYLVIAMVSRSKYEDIPYLKYLIIWVGIFLGLTLLYSFKDVYYDVKDRIVSQLSPSTAIEEDGIIMVKKSLDDHFYINVEVNGRRVKFMVDTGATDVVMTKTDAHKVGIDMNNLKFTKVYNTANGKVFGANVKLDKIAVGKFELENFEVSVNSGEMRTSLLGMSLLTEFDFYKFEGDTLYLKY